MRPDLARPSALNLLPATISQDYFDWYEAMSSAFVFARVSRRVPISEQVTLILIVALAVAARRATSEIGEGEAESAANQPPGREKSLGRRRGVGRLLLHVQSALWKLFLFTEYPFPLDQNIVVSSYGDVFDNALL